jgi:hypothetical protein
MKMKKNDTNVKDAIVDIAKSLETVFKKYSKNTREKAWDKLTSKDGEKEIKKILVDPSRPINTFQKLATQKDESINFKDWLVNEEKDACYHKVKSRYSVWPSAYGSGALVRCRKVGAKNWGNSKKEQVEITEALKDKKQYDDAAQAIMALHYQGIDAEKASSKEIEEALVKMKKIPENTDIKLFVARIKSIANGSTKPEDFKENTFKLEKERGLKGWFDRNQGKGWIDCKASKKGNLVPCGRKKTGKGAEREYPACRPTLSACNKKGKKRKKSSKRISWE